MLKYEKISNRYTKKNNFLEGLRKTIDWYKRFYLNYNFNKILKANKPYIIAEVGINHNGQIKLAKKMIKIAKKIGANCVKFQYFNAERLISKYAPKAPYQKVNKKIPG